MRTLAFAAVLVVTAAVAAGCPSKPKPAGEGEGEGAAEGEGEGGEGEGEGGPVACGDVTAAGSCVSATAGAFCDAGGARVDFDCSAVRDDAVCFVVNDSYGVDCGVPTDSLCFDDTNGILPCAGDGFACVITSPTRGQCQVVASGCTAAGACIEGKLAKDCLGGSDGHPGQPTLLDCASFAATCVDGAGCLRDPGAACTPGVTECGTSVDDHVPCPAAGTCPPPAAGEGEGEGEGEGGQ